MWLDAVVWEKTKHNSAYDVGPPRIPCVLISVVSLGLIVVLSH